MKSSLLTGFRALLFALGTFVLLAVSGIKVRSSGDVALFVLGLAAFWVLIERIFLSLKQKQKNTPGPK
jgi:hypothetical protein